jgi:DNA polymerase-3 subunit epsilon
VALGAQRTFDDLGAPLHEVPFCVLDIETTGGVASDLGITEIGAVRYVGGVPQREFHALINPGSPIPPFITVLTGITHAMVIEAPPLEEVLPTFLEFLGDAVVVGHNVRYDLSFLNAAALHFGYGKLPNRSSDTLSLARRLVRTEVRNLKLATLAAYFSSPTPPTHRALDDAKATAHVFWALLERAGTIGVSHLDDLIALPSARGGAHYRKIRLADELPRRPGVYLFRDRAGEVFYVGKAKNLRNRVRSYFYGDTRRSVGNMLRELADIDYRVCETELEAEVTELRLIASHRPRHNRRSKPPKSSHWVKLTDEAFPRLSIVRTWGGDAQLRLGPFRSKRSAGKVVEALWDATPLRRCTGRPGTRAAKCGFAQLGRALCPCSGELAETDYAAVVATVTAGVETDPGLLLEPLGEKMADHARNQRFEEASWLRDRYRALARSLEGRRAWLAMQKVGMIHAEDPEGGSAIIERGRLVAAWAGNSPPLDAALRPPQAPIRQVPDSVGEAEEARLLWKWLNGNGVRIVEATGPLAMPAKPVPELKAIEV